jgi:hypothetical protein
MARRRDAFRRQSIEDDIVALFLDRRGEDQAVQEMVRPFVGIAGIVGGGTIGSEIDGQTAVVMDERCNVVLGNVRSFDSNARPAVVAMTLAGVLYAAFSVDPRLMWISSPPLPGSIPEEFVPMKFPAG